MKTSEEVKASLLDLARENGFNLELIIEKDSGKEKDKFIDLAKSRGFSFEEMQMIFRFIDKFYWYDRDWHPPQKINKDDFCFIPLSDYQRRIIERNPGKVIYYINEENYILCGFVPSVIFTPKEYVTIMVSNKFFYCRAESKLPLEEEIEDTFISSERLTVDDDYNPTEGTYFYVSEKKKIKH